MSLFTTQSEAVNYERTKGFTIIKSKLARVTFAFATRSGRVHLKAWRGAAVNASFYYCFNTLARAEQYAAEFARDCQSREARKAAQVAERKAARAALKASDHWTVGDTVYTSWGYDQTNVEFYQITEVKARSVKVRQIRVNNSDHGQPGGGKVAPRRFEYVGPEFLCPLDERGSFSAGPCHGKDKPSWRNHCHKWTGRAVYTSSDR